VSYANDTKTSFLGVRPETLVNHGAVSEQTAGEMVAGVCARTGASCGISITGIAGPGGGTPDKPVGTVCVGTHVAGETRARTLRLGGERAEVRERSAQAALAWLRKRVRAEGG
jgi:nicotinamide-nucleotide amidase